jgi:hypothetical protein
VSNLEKRKKECSIYFRKGYIGVVYRSGKVFAGKKSGSNFGSVYTLGQTLSTTACLLELLQLKTTAAAGAREEHGCLVTGGSSGHDSLWKVAVGKGG